MLGSILGDIVGSRFEFMSTQEKDVKLFHSACSWTDDTALTYAVSKVCSFIKQNNITDVETIEQLFITEFKTVVKDFPMAGWGKQFYKWALSPNYYSNDSAGNGCLMRISPIVFYFKDLDTVQKIGRICTKISHNHPDSYKSVEAFLEILHYLFHSLNYENNNRKEKIIEIINKHNIKLDSVEELHKIGGYWGLAKDTLPRALAGYLESDDYRTTMRNMLYIGSDTDTTATIAGGLAELTYSIDNEDIHHLYRYFDHKSFHMVKTICKQYTDEDNQELFNKLFDKETINIIHELISHHPVDQTAQWDPLELPSDEDYYGIKPKFSLKKFIIDLFLKH